MARALIQEEEEHGLFALHGGNRGSNPLGDAINQ
jgi:hypothetical protein